MNIRTVYHYLNHIDAPKRYFSLTMDELVVAVLSLMLLVMSNHKVFVALLGAVLLTTLRRLKKGASPKALLVLAYWHLPHGLTQFFLPKLPASYQRVWVA